MSPPLRASNEGLPRPRVARAQGTHRAIPPLLADFFNSLLGFFDLDDRLALVRSAIQAGVMRQLDLVALWTDGHARRGNAQFLCAPLVAAFP